MGYAAGCLGVTCGWAGRTGLRLCEKLSLPYAQAPSIILSSCVTIRREGGVSSAFFLDNRATLG